jgi:hypothetical protein
MTARRNASGIFRDPFDRTFADLHAARAARMNARES